MEVDRVKRVLSSLMILSFLIFGLLAGIIFITDVPLNATTAALPFVLMSALTWLTNTFVNGCTFACL